MGEAKNRENTEYLRDVRDAVLRAMGQGAEGLQDVLKHLGEVDPRLVKAEFEKIVASESATGDNLVTGERGSIYDRELASRRLSASLPLKLPCSDPVRCQWWFSLDCVVELARRSKDLSVSGSACFMGAPTIGYYFSHAYDNESVVLDADNDVVNCLQRMPGIQAELYDIANPLPDSHKDRFSVAIMDPPWYPSVCQKFLCRGIESVQEKGYVLCVLPGLLTRPGVKEERSELLSLLVKGNVDVVSLETGVVSYRVPRFEAAAYQNVEGFSARHWRRGDLLILRKRSIESAVEDVDITHEKIESFSRHPEKFRVFVSLNRSFPNLESEITIVSEFGKAVSSRVANLSSVSAWTTERAGVALRAPLRWVSVLEAWSEGGRVEMLEAYKLEFGELGEDVFDSFCDALGLFNNIEISDWRRSPEILERARAELLSDLSASPSPRSHKSDGDGFRLEFQRDRDRVLWSKGLKSLADKTQLFPVDTDDQLRRRSSHSIEVMQLASTIATSFGLDRDLAEAGALAHDIGHTPFGHAGEHALNEVLDEIEPSFGGFNHYEHGLDVVRWLETPYRSPGAGEIPGLNLTRETEECIVKHTYYRANESLGQTAVLARSKHKDIPDSFCHLEGQAVRIADKISYLISDLEDGIRIGAIGYDDLIKCRFFENPPIDITPSKDEILFDRFISQRGAMLRVLMEDVLQASDRRLQGVSSLSEIRNSGDYVINHSEWIQEDVGEVWSRLQAGILHKDASVEEESMRAARIVRSLFLLYCIAPNLIDRSFRHSHVGLKGTEYIKWYTERVGPTIGVPRRLVFHYALESAIGTSLRIQGDNCSVETYYAVLAKDYVASLTDSRAREEFRKHCLVQ